MNFAKFARWPDGALQSKNKVNLCVLGNRSLEIPFHTIEGKKIRNRKLHVRLIAKINELIECDILFIAGELEKKILARILAKVKNKPVLTIGDMSGFAQNGGVINFVHKNGKIRFEISPKHAALQGGISLSSRLLQLAIIVD